MERKSGGASPLAFWRSLQSRKWRRALKSRKWSAAKLAGFLIKTLLVFLDARLCGNDGNGANLSTDYQQFCTNFVCFRNLDDYGSVAEYRLKTGGLAVLQNIAKIWEVNDVVPTVKTGAQWGRK